MNGKSVRYWLLMLRKPGQWIEFDAAAMGVTQKTLFDYVELENRRANGRYKACSIDDNRIGVRFVHPAGGKHA